MEQLILLLLFGAIALIQWLVKKSAEMRAERKRERQAQGLGQEEKEVFQDARGVEPPAPEQDPDASMRRLMEALGLPQEAQPPPIPQRPVSPPPLPPAPVQRVPEQPMPPVPERSAPRAVERPAFKLPEKPLASASKRFIPVSKSTFSEPPETKPDFSIRQLLSSPDSMKKAVILSEIIGTPKALRS